jgi:UDP-N-acetylmuramate--alanine ligase
MAMNSMFYGRVRTIHFVGIGGIGMSGIAEVLLDLGLCVQGSDLQENDNVKRLEAKGARIFFAHSKNNVDGVDVVVKSSDIKPDNPELIAAKECGIPVVPRAEMLAELMRFKHGIAIMGAHGKTTTTSLVATVLEKAELDPTVVIGGKLNHLKSNAKTGRGQFMVAEADESDGSFLHLSPSIIALTNIDKEHLNFWTSVDAIKSAFTDFINRLPFYGLLVACSDDIHVQAILPLIERRVTTYGLDTEFPADYTATDIVYDGLFTHFQVQKKGALLGQVNLQLVGRHNVQNALAAIAVADELGLSFELIKNALQMFGGVQRRFTVVGEHDGIMVVDDYGHHPTEIEAVLKAASSAFPARRIHVLFQPHRFSRTKALFDEFSNAFSSAHHVIITDIYAAQESPIEGICSEHLAKAIAVQSKNTTVLYGGNLEDATRMAAALAKPGDVLITLGAGSITKSANTLLALLRS